ncbi:hypothetical protein DMC30DRAFT_232056 [Rhodotorula diobovata]|uniref:Uncharacterized protein n=1 Tax=Rhodotorula diobovata TaxID=5288 RepID=A0A5C5FX45_9BASI|nr:hypothetical protein DMC30DRAFT_232056 [Rhodotorula diobovata]
MPTRRNSFRDRARSRSPRTRGLSSVEDEDEPTWEDYRATIRSVVDRAAQRIKSREYALHNWGGHLSGIKARKRWSELDKFDRAQVVAKVEALAGTKEVFPKSEIEAAQFDRKNRAVRDKAASKWAANWARRTGTTAVEVKSVLQVYISLVRDVTASGIAHNRGRAHSSVLRQIRDWGGRLEATWNFPWYMRMTDWERADVRARIEAARPVLEGAGEDPENIQARSRKSKQPARSSHTQHSAASHSVDPPWTGDDPLSFVDLDAFPSYPDPAPTHPLAPPLFEPHHAGSHALPFPPDYPPLPALPPAPPAPEHSIDPRLLDPALDAPHSAHGPFDGFPALQHVARFNAAAALPPPSGAYAPRRRAEGERDAGRRVLRCLGAGAIRRGRGAGIGRW